MPETNDAAEKLAASGGVVSQARDSSQRNDAAPRPSTLNDTSGLSGQGTTWHAAAPETYQTVRGKGSFMRKWLARAWSLKSLVFATFTFFLLASFTLSADSLNSPLAKISPSNGVLLLTILVLFNGYSFSAAADKLWEKVQWGRFLKKGEPLLTFFTLGSEVNGSLKILARGWSPRYWKRRSSTERSQFKRSLGHPRWWSLAR